MDNQTPIVLRPGDAVKLKALSADGAAMLLQEGSLWTVLRVEASVLALDLEPGLLIAADKQGTRARWLAFSDPDVYIEPCLN
jgi:hypothetical protein